MQTALLKLVWIGFLVLCQAACVSPSPGPKSGPAFHADQFFLGDTSGKGKLLFRSGRIDQSFKVRSSGRYGEDGQFVLSQIINWSNGDQQARTFQLRRQGENRWVGHFVGGDIRVVLKEEGNVGHLRHGLPGVPFARMEQYLYLQADERSVINEGTVRVFGITVRRFHEVIERPLGAGE